jgi:hypothetical protein
MKLGRQIVLLGALALASAVPALAQVDKAAMRTTGIACGVCAMVSEVGLRKINGIDKVTISRSNEAIMIAYKPGAAFLPAEIRKVLEPLNVGIAQFQISARGRVEDQGGKLFFVAGRDRFVLTPPAANAPKVPTTGLVSIEGVLNDRRNPMELRVLAVKPVSQ